MTVNGTLAWACWRTCRRPFADSSPCRADSGCDPVVHHDPPDEVPGQSPCCADGAGHLHHGPAQVPGAAECSSVLALLGEHEGSVGGSGSPSCCHYATPGSGGLKTCFCCFGRNQMFFYCDVFCSGTSISCVGSEYLTVDEGTFSPFSCYSKDLIKKNLKLILDSFWSCRTSRTAGVDTGSKITDKWNLWLDQSGCCIFWG